MSFDYSFPNTICNKLNALDYEIRQTFPWAAADFQGLTTYPELHLIVSRALTDNELASLTTFMDAYVDPVAFLEFDHTETIALHSHFTTDFDNVIADNGQKILQTLIFGYRNENSTVLDACKTVIEYLAPDVTKAPTSASVVLDIYDITRNVLITTQTIDISDVCAEWQAMVSTGATGPRTIYRTTMFTGLMNKNPGYDCIWQIRGSVSDETKFTFRISGLQNIIYNVS